MIVEIITTIFVQLFQYLTNSNLMVMFLYYNIIENLTFDLKICRGRSLKWLDKEENKLTNWYL